MSFILDALKKSEIERQQSSSTEFAAVPTNPGTRAFPRWFLVVGFLLAINLVVLIGLLLRQDSSSTSRANVPVTSIAEPAPAVVERPEAARSSFEEQVAAAKQNRPARQEPNVSTAAVEPDPDLQAVLISQNPSTVTPQQLYPTLQEVRASGTLDLPDLHLDIHVYSDVPADRFVFINMAKHREGSQMNEGPTLVEITPDGVVLQYRSRSFLVPRD